MPPFTPAYRDGRSAASLIVELAHGKPYGYVLTYEEIASQLGIAPTDLVRIRAAIARTKDRLLREHKRGIEARAGEGYVILHPGQHAHLATEHRRKSDRQIKRAIRVIKGADERDMNPMELERNRQFGMVLERLHERQQDTEDRVARLESLMLGTTKVISGTAEPAWKAIAAESEEIELPRSLPLSATARQSHPPSLSPRSLSSLRRRSRARCICSHAAFASSCGRHGTASIVILVPQDGQAASIRPLPSSPRSAQAAHPLSAA